MRCAIVLLVAAPALLGCTATGAVPRLPSRTDDAAPPPAPRFSAAVRHATRTDVRLSWRPGCPVGWRSLRMVRITHWGFDGRVHTGRLVVHRDVAASMVAVMRGLFQRRYPIRRMLPVDAYGADDHRSMAADNTSAFNCRFVGGTARWSQHAFGRAVDLNPVENPYVTGSHVSPAAGAAYADRSRHRAGMVHDGDPVVRLFAAHGWRWGGRWPGDKDYQHFSTTGG
jgi:hypothetical protein